MEKEVIILNKERNVTLTAYLQPVEGVFTNITKRPAVLVLPGGGYQYCSDREADPVALAFAQAGYQAFILRYSVAQNNTWPNPFNDVEQAIEMIRSKKEWNVYPDKVAVAGFSAGGHLAAAAATLAKNRPNAAILGYAVLGHDVKACSMTAPDLIPYVNADTCPCFIFASRTDDLVPVHNSLRFMEALDRAKVSFESHIYAYGPHGFSVGNSGIRRPGRPFCSRYPKWIEDSIEWLKDMFGDFGDGQMTEPACGTHFSGDFEKYLSKECTIGHLMKNSAARAVLSEVDSILACNQDMIDAVSGMQLKGILGFMRVPKEKIDEIDTKLRAILNEE